MTCCSNASRAGTLAAVAKQVMLIWSSSYISSLPCASESRSLLLLLPNIALDGRAFERGSIQGCYGTSSLLCGGICNCALACAGLLEDFDPLSRRMGIHVLLELLPCSSLSQTTNP